MFPVRGGPVTASAWNVTVPLPRPSRPDVIEIHDTPELAVQEQVLALARTFTLKSPPPLPTDSWFDETVSSHGFPACEMSTR